MDKIFVALSGGVDSSVAAALLKEQGYEVEGVFMKNWSPESAQSLSDCPWMEDQADAEAVCATLGIPFRSINFEIEYREKVLNYFFAEYEKGRTPNPDVMCNREIKFRVLLDAVMKWGGGRLATGHYAGVEECEDGYHLLRGVDSKKDQSYFLWKLDQPQLQKSIFPLANMTKVDVREQAGRFALPTANKKDSQGICFIGKLDVKKYLLEHITTKTGEVYLLGNREEVDRKKTAQKVGEHRGTMFYTVGERAGAIVDNRLFTRLHPGDVPHLYIAEKDNESNILYVVDDREDPAMFKKCLTISEFNYLGASPDPVKEVIRRVAKGGITVQIRYQQKDVYDVESVEESEGGILVRTKNSMWSVAAGQSAVLYYGNRVLAGGVIDKAD
jgi:tRNA-specific 2-thiouridylase